MKPFDILDALSDLPEEYAAFAVQKQASVPNTETEQIKQNPQGGIVMNNAKAEYLLKVVIMQEIMKMIFFIRRSTTVILTE